MTPELVKMFRSLGTPTRLRIVELLGTRPGGRTVTWIASELSLRPSVVSDNLRVLANVDLVWFMPSGNRRYYLLGQGFGTIRLWLSNYGKEKT